MGDKVKIIIAKSNLLHDIDHLHFKIKTMEEERRIKIENMKTKSGVANKYDGGYHIVAGRSNGKTFVSNNSTDFLDAIKYCYNDIYTTNLLAQYEYNKQCRGSWNNKLEIKKVIFNDPATIVFWKDGTKTVVKCENEEFDEEKGLAMAIVKSVFGKCCQRRI